MVSEIRQRTDRQTDTHTQTDRQTDRQTNSYRNASQRYYRGKATASKTAYVNSLSTCNLERVNKERRQTKERACLLNLHEYYKNCEKTVRVLARDAKVAGSTPGRSTLSGNNLGKVVHTRVRLSPSSIIWCRSRGGDALRLGR